MMKQVLKISLAVILAASVSTVVVAVGPEKSAHDHAAHAMPESTKRADTLAPLSKLPPSGVVREAGYDGRYAMEATSADDALSSQCAKATRGLVIMDNVDWKKCGGKPEGVPKSPAAETKPAGQSSHVGH